MKNLTYIIKEELTRFLLESSKVEILTKKEGLDSTQATLLNELCGGLAVWMLDKIKKDELIMFESFTILSPERSGIRISDLYLNFSEDREEFDKMFKSMDSKTKIDLINRSKIIENKKNIIEPIMDWIKYGLNGNVKPYKNLSLRELINLSKEWSITKNLEINYVEKNPIILDFRGNDGFGFYWTDLKTQKSDEECERMNHCGRSDKGYLYSFRSNKPFGKDYTINKSHLTASIGTDGTLYQLKGRKNSKPKEEYYSYILPLFYVKKGGDYLIKGLGSEWNPNEDFNMSDLPESVVDKLVKDRPELFE